MLFIYLFLKGVVFLQLRSRVLENPCQAFLMTQHLSKTFYIVFPFNLSAILCVFLGLSYVNFHRHFLAEQLYLTVQHYSPCMTIQQSTIALESHGSDTMSRKRHTSNLLPAYYETVAGHRSLCMSEHHLTSISQRSIQFML